MEKFTNIVNEGNIQKLKLGIDIHGVINNLPELFSFITRLIVENGGEVHVLTGASWTPEVDKELQSYGIHYTHRLSVYDYLIEHNSPTIGEIQFPDGTIQKKFNDEEWDKVKGTYCRDNGIHLHIDDTLIYNEYFSTPFARLFTHTNTPKAGHKDVRHQK